jgi:photosystem II stability/assembly factor-like uncharacterized protein
VSGNGSTWWVVGDGGTILRSTDGGATWTAGGRQDFFDFQAVRMTDEHNVVVVGMGGVIFRGTR